MSERNHTILIGPVGSPRTVRARALANRWGWKRGRHVYTVAKDIAAQARDAAPAVDKAPFRSPPYTCSRMQLTGVLSGWKYIPGELSRAHGGVLFCDDLPKFRHEALVAIRYALRDRQIDLVSRVEGRENRLMVPADFTLIATMRECPCGNAGGPNEDDCECTPREITHYQNSVRYIREWCRVERVPLESDLTPNDGATVRLGRGTG